jgi:hypothetical protein
MLENDGDIVRGLGFVTMYASWLEDDVDEILHLLDPVVPFTQQVQRWPISRKLEQAATAVEGLHSDELVELPRALRDAIALFARRNEMVHGRIYAGFDRTDYVKSGRANNPEREVTSAELYTLANDLWEYRGNFIGPQLFRLPRAVEAFRCSR